MNNKLEMLRIQQSRWGILVGFIWIGVLEFGDEGTSRTKSIERKKAMS